jgi:hypothetical protein
MDTKTYDLARIIAIIKSNRISTVIAATNPVALSKYNDSYEHLRREAAIWNAVTCLAKGKEKQAALHLPLEKRSQWLWFAKKRWFDLCDWTTRNKTKADILCAPVIAEYQKREERRLAQV